MYRATRLRHRHRAQGSWRSRRRARAASCASVLRARRCLSPPQVRCTIGIGLSRGCRKLEMARRLRADSISHAAFSINQAAQEGDRHGQRAQGLFQHLQPSEQIGPARLGARGRQTNHSFRSRHPQRVKGRGSICQAARGKISRPLMLVPPRYASRCRVHGRHCRGRGHVRGRRHHRGRGRLPYRRSHHSPWGFGCSCSPSRE